MHGRDYLNPIGWALIGGGTAIEFVQLHGLSILSVIALVIGSVCHVIQTRIKVRQDRSRRAFENHKFSYIQKSRSGLSDAADR